MSGLSVIVKTSSRLMIPLILIVAANVIFHGDVTPGGGFQGGTIAAAALTLYVVAFGVPLDVRRLENVKGLISVGLGIIGVCALAGPLYYMLTGSRHFMQNRGLFPTGTPGWIFGSGSISFFGLGEGLHIAMGFTLVILVYSILMEFGFRRKNSEAKPSTR